MSLQDEIENAIDAMADDLMTKGVEVWTGGPSSLPSVHSSGPNGERSIVLRREAQPMGRGRISQMVTATADGGHTFFARLPAGAPVEPFAERVVAEAVHLASDPALRPM